MTSAGGDGAIPFEGGGEGAANGAEDALVIRI
jgi:hypothetical protein